jgi:NitT/TauT family transport system ATP-binding protein
MKTLPLSTAPPEEQKTAQAILQLDSLDVVFPDENGGLHALDDVSFSISPQEFVCVLGPSGCGKSSLLRVLAGTVQPTNGKVRLSSTGEEHRQLRVGFMFQHANLMPWRTALENIMLPLELQGMPLEKARTKAEEWIELVGLQDFETTWPRDLSGGMAQRVALARALIQDPDLLLLDEPFGALDALTRERMGHELLSLWQARKKTVLMVTHSISEALMLSDRVLVMTPRPGHIHLDLPVDLPRERDEETRYTQRFNELARHLRAAIG